jgi:hypothetical protein
MTARWARCGGGGRGGARRREVSARRCIECCRACGGEGKGRGRPERRQCGRPGEEQAAAGGRRRA